MGVKDGIHCPYCGESRSIVLSLAIHVSLKHKEKENEFCQKICDRKIVSKKGILRGTHGDRKIAAVIARANLKQVRYYKTAKSNYKMPQEFHFMTPQIPNRW